MSAADFRAEQQGVAAGSGITQLAIGEKELLSDHPLKRWRCLRPRVVPFTGRRPSLKALPARKGPRR